MTPLRTFSCEFSETLQIFAFTWYFQVTVCVQRIIFSITVAKMLITNINIRSFCLEFF